MEAESLGPDYRRLLAWSEACDLAVAVYLMCRANRTRLDADIIHQLRRAAASVPSNIAEGNSKGTNKDTLKYLYIARGSLAELETQIANCTKVGFLSSADACLVIEQSNRVGRLIGGLIRYRKSRLDGQPVRLISPPSPPPSPLAFCLLPLAFFLTPPNLPFMLRLNTIRARIAPARQRLLAHPLYQRMGTLEDVQVFMGSHVFAVWDFMSLLKRLQRDLTCVTVPWIPVGDAEVRFLINEIVCGEESDVDPKGGRIAHFDLYLRAMHEAGASTEAIERALAVVRAGGSTATALVAGGVSAGAAAFSGSTFALATRGQAHEVAAAFTFGREDLIPDMFTELVTRLSQEYPGKLDTFRYYLERHIEIDGGHHGAISLRMVELLCGDDERKWQEAADAAVAAIEARLALWEAIMGALRPVTAA